MDEQLQQLIHSYKPADEFIDTIKSVPKVFLVGIAAAGKNAVLQKVIESGDYYELITCTTRPPRSNGGQMEKEGDEYYFISKQKAIDMLLGHEFVEAKWVHRQNLYGTTVSEFKKAKSLNKKAIADIDVAGVDEYMKFAAESTKPIFILPPNFDIWEQRFKARYEGLLGEGEFQRRLYTAAQEIEHALSQHYYSIIINDDLEDATLQIQSIANGEDQSDISWQRGSKVAHELLEAIRASTH